jgi:hypothetical protein
MIIDIYNRKDASKLNINWADIYYTPSYGKLSEITDRGLWEVCIGRDENNKDDILIYYVYIKRPVIYQEQTYYDLTTPYGYSGLWTNDNKYIDKFRELFEKYALDNHYICEFIRYNPYLLNYINDNMILSRKTYGILLKDYDTNNLSSRNKYSIKKAIKDNYFFNIKKFSQLDSTHNSQFRKLYDQNMISKNASKYYLFNDQYFDLLTKLDDIYIATVSYLDNYIGFAIFIVYNKNIHYHLACNMKGYKNISNYMLDRVAVWAKTNNLELLHLGGGVTSDDSLDKFKRSISNVEYNYFYEKKIINKYIYNDLSSKFNNNNPNYFPAYRSAI